MVRQPQYTLEEIKRVFPKRVVERRIPELMTLAEAKKRPEPDPIPTDGTITIGEAARQNNIPHSTVSRWIKRGLITVKHYTRNGRYVEPADVKAVADKYKTDPGRGKRTALQAA